MVPLVNSKADAEQAVSYCYFPPEGQRSAAYPVRCAHLLQYVVPASLLCIVQQQQQQRQHMLRSQKNCT
jgi:2-keto-3-deoxy-L-rhamnonate aldolase RhmA